MKSVSLLGSTGSIGTQTLDVIRKNNDIKVVALAAGTRVKELAEQAREFKPQLVSVGTQEKAKELKVLLSDMDVKIVYGMEGLIEAATIDEADIVADCGLWAAMGTGQHRSRAINCTRSVLSSSHCTPTSRSHYNVSFIYCSCLNKSFHAIYNLNIHIGKENFQLFSLFLCSNAYKLRLKFSGLLS